MNTRLYSTLTKAIDDWCDAECESFDWPDIIIGERTSDMMAKAARAVFDACEESQGFALREGYVKSSH